MGSPTPTWTDTELHQLALEHDEAAQVALYRRFAGTVHRASRAVVRDEDLADDIVQEVFVAYFTDPDRHDPTRGPLGPYLTMVAKRRAIDIVRSREAERRREERAALLGGAAGTDDDGIDRLLTRIDVRRAVEVLPPSQRQVIGAAYGLDRTYGDAARVLGIAEGTAKSRARLALARLRHDRALAAA